MVPPFGKKTPLVYLAEKLHAIRTVCMSKNVLGFLIFIGAESGFF